MPANNLPVLLTPLIGREAEIAWVQSHLEDPLCRLITLTGPGGIGKTHMTLQAVKATLKSFPDGAFLISVAALPSTPDFVPRLAQVLDLPSQNQTDLHSQLIDFLRPKSLLLILDSFEHLIAAPGLASQTGSKVVNSLLQEAPRLKIMVTSRMALNLPAWAPSGTRARSKSPSNSTIFPAGFSLSVAFVLFQQGLVDPSDLDAGPDAIVEFLQQMRPLSAHRILRPFLEAYRVVADVLQQHSVDDEIDERPVPLPTARPLPENELPRPLPRPTSRPD